MLSITYLLLILGLWFYFDGYSRQNEKENLEHRIRIIKDDDILLLWNDLNVLNKKIIFYYMHVLPVCYWACSLIFLVFHFKNFTFPKRYFSDYPLITILISVVLMIIAGFAGNLPILIEKDPYFNRRQSGQLCGLDVTSHKRNLIILYKTIGGSRYSTDTKVNFPEDINFLQKVIFISKNLGKIAVLWHLTIFFIIILIIFIIIISN